MLKQLTVRLSYTVQTQQVMYTVSLKHFKRILLIIAVTANLTLYNVFHECYISPTTK